MTIITRAENPFPNIPRPLGARSVADWVDVNSDLPSRYFEGTRRVVDCRDETLEVCADGIQRADGSVEGAITVTGDSSMFERLILASSAEARQFARALMAAADEYDRLT